jgi:hypothetical protein
VSDEDKTSAGPPPSDQTVRIPAELLSILPPPSDAPPPPPGAAGPPPPPPPPGSPGSRRDYGGPGPDDDDRRGGSWIWLLGALVVAVVFIGACYIVVARAEEDRPQTATAPGAEGDGSTSTTTASTTTTAPPTTQAPAEVAVVVLNGSGQRGWAGENLALLEAAGYTGEASDARSEDIETTTVYIADETLRGDGAAVAAVIEMPDAPVEIRPEEPLGITDAADTADVVVVLGADSLG